ncbi:SGNH/GDSL hydrolase family protein [Camelliibacillus cellulosilyticus]|uniref:SGNH/GDSL hydrolase family protein n=1 Tax=Camelliibacillus cellulosilyticus TaxID=2174486 RepID=A0ABV9GH85_9BACL
MTAVKKRWMWPILSVLIILIFGAVGFFITRALVPYDGAPQNIETFKSQMPEKQTAINITAIGDSLTKGVGDPDGKGYAGQAAKSLENLSSVSGVHFVDHGIKGDTTDDLLAVLKKEEVRQDLKNADMIFLTIGGNDLVNVFKKHFLDLKLSDFNKQRLDFQKNFNVILADIRKLNPKATIYYIGLYNPFEDYFADLNDEFKAILDQWNGSSQTILELYPNTVFIPTYDLFEGKTDQLLSGDHFHPNRAGYQLIANRLIASIKH